MMPESRYTPVDRLLYRLAFAAMPLQIDMAEIEDRLYAARLSTIELDAPVFITSLPRAGTTLVLDLITRAPGIASHTYRDLPFIACPMLWQAMSQPLRKDNIRFERAHADGIHIGYDSPEAFEEALWRAWFPQHYGASAIRPWSTDETPGQFASFFASHMRKIVALRCGTQGRYVSKNNGNIARLGFLRTLFPACRIVVPFRDPAAQVHSLLTQHRRFLDMHARSSFARRYMENIGHFDFGANLRPINFAGDAAPIGDAKDPNFWLRYWIAAFEHVLTQVPLPLLLDYDDLCAQPVDTLAMLADRLDLPPDRILAAAATIRSPKPVATDALDPILLRRARDLHADLRAHCPSRAV